MNYLNTKQAEEKHYDPDLPDANALMASLCCVAAQYAWNPTIELARLAASLAHRLATPHYAESKLIAEVAETLIRQWEAIVDEQAADLSSVVPSSTVVQ